MDPESFLLLPLVHGIDGWIALATPAKAVSSLRLDTNTTDERGSGFTRMGFNGWGGWKFISIN